MPIQIPEHSMSTKLYVGNIPYSASADELNNHFSKVGDVKSVDRLSERRTGRNRGFCFIEMDTPQDAQQAVTQLNGLPLSGRNLRVVLARPNNS